ncbi:MAG: DUF2141 domain-containing protein [Cyanobacteria bacterium J06626_14]
MTLSHLIPSQTLSPISFMTQLRASTFRLTHSLVGIATIALTSGVFSFSPSAQATSNSQLAVQVSGIRNQDGQVCLSLFAGQQGFPSRNANAVRSECIAATTSQPQIVFDNLSPGSYAVAVLHDSNNDQSMNRNFLGIPSEGFGFSGNPVIRSGPPAFSEALVLVAGPRTDIQIRLTYL